MGCEHYYGGKGLFLLHLQDKLWRLYPSHDRHGYVHKDQLMCSVLASTNAVESFLVCCNSKLSVQRLINFKLEVFFYHYLHCQNIELIIVHNQDSWPAVTHLAIVLTRLSWRGLCYSDWLFLFDLLVRLEIERDVRKTFRIVNINFFHRWLHRILFKFYLLLLTYDVEQPLIYQVFLLFSWYLIFDSLAKLFFLRAH